MHVKQPDIIERLSAVGKLPIRDILPLGDSDVFFDARDEILRLREEVETWKNRWQAEKQDHEATMKAWDEERSGL
jgi:hypothetical protein